MSARYTDYARAVRIEMLKRDLHYKELCELVNGITGLRCDEPYLSRVVNGRTPSRKVVTAINEILGIEEDSIGKN